MISENKGFITLAFGRKYLEMALDMALSLREFHEEPISIAVDHSAARRLARYRNHPFDKIITLPQNVHPWGAKFLVVEACPYRHAAYIDADILFTKPSPFLSYDFKAPLAMYGAYIPPDKDFQTYFSIKQICADFALNRYFWATSGIFLFHKESALDMFRACYDFYTVGIKAYPRYSGGSIPDEMVFGILSDHYEIEQIPSQSHPWPTENELKTITAGDKHWSVIHLFAPPHEIYFRHLIDGIERRRRAYDLPNLSEKIWRDKAFSIPTFRQKLMHVLRRFRLSSLSRQTSREKTITEKQHEFNRSKN